MTSAAATASDVNLALSPPLCHSSPATATAASRNGGARSPPYQYGYGSAPHGVAMTTFRRDAAQSYATGNGGRLPCPHVDDDVSRFQLDDVEAVCPTCTATRYCRCCSSQTLTTQTQPVADV